MVTVTGTLIPAQLYFSFAVVLYAFFLAKSKVFLLQESRCSIALLVTLVVLYCSLCGNVYSLFTTLTL